MPATDAFIGPRPLHRIPTPQSASQNVSKIVDQFQYPPCVLRASQKHTYRSLSVVQLVGGSPISSACLYVQAKTEYNVSTKILVPRNQPSKEKSEAKNGFNFGYAFFFCWCRARSKLWRSSIHWLRLSIPTHENKVKRYLRCLPNNQKAATNTNKQQKQKPNSPTKKQANNKQKTGHLVRRVKHYAFRKVPMPLSTASRWNSNITHIYPTNPKVIIHCMWQWYKSYWATPGVGSSYQNCSTVIATTASRCPINLSHCSSM